MSEFQLPPAALTPDAFRILQVVIDGRTDYRIFSNQYGGYLESETWRLSSGGLPEEIEDCGDAIVWPQHSGSVYTLYKRREGRLLSWGRHILQSKFLDPAARGEVPDIMIECVNLEDIL